MPKKYLSVKSKCGFPLPDSPSFRDNSRGQNAIKGFEYWKNLPPEAAPLARCRVYRLDPPIDLKKIGISRTSIELWEGAIPFEPEDYEKNFYHLFGAGAYKCLLEEQGVSGVVCDIWFTLPDKEGFPPKIDDRTLCLDAPGGKEYVAWRARRGEPVAGSEPEQQSEGDDFMEIGGKTQGGSTAAVLVGGLVDMAQSQVTRAQQEADEAKKSADEARKTASTESSPNLTLQAAGESIKLIADTSRDLMNGNKAPNPVEMFTAIAGIMPKPAPPPDMTPFFNTILTVVQTSNETVMKMVLQQNQDLKQEIQTLRQAPSTALVTTANGDGMAELEKFQKMASLLGYSRGGESAAPARPMAEVMAEWMPIINMGMSMVQTIVAAVTAPKPVPGAPPPPTANGVPQTAPPPPAAPPPDSPQAQMLRFMEKLEKPFLSHLLSPDFTGFDFARHILTDGNGGSMETNTGRAQYNQIKQNFGIRPDKTCGLDMLIQQYPPIWDIAKGDKPSYQRFLSEFFSYDEQVDQPPQKPS